MPSRVRGECHTARAIHASDAIGSQATFGDRAGTALTSTACVAGADLSGNLEGGASAATFDAGARAMSPCDRQHGLHQAILFMKKVTC
jgi:hypothetical protein